MQKRHEQRIHRLHSYPRLGLHSRGTGMHFGPQRRRHGRVMQQVPLLQQATQLEQHRGDKSLHLPQIRWHIPKLRYHPRARL